MFKLKFFTGFVKQRKAFLEAKSYAALPVHTAVLASIKASQDYTANQSLDLEKTNIWLSSLKAIKPLIARSIFANILIALCSFVMVLQTRAILENTKNLNIMLFACFAIMVVEVIRIIIQNSDTIWRAQAARCLQFHLFSIINRKLVSVDSNCSGEFTSGNLKTLVASDVESVEHFISAACQNWVPTIILLIVMTPLIYYMTGVLGLVGIFVALLQIPIAFIFARYIEKFQSRMMVYQDALTTLVGEWVRNIRLVRYLGWQSVFEKDIASGVRKFTLQGMMHHFILVLTFAMSFTWWMFPILVIFLLAQSWDYKLDLLSIFSSIWALSYLMNHIQHVPYAVSLYGSAVAGVKRIEKFLSLPEQRSRIIKKEKSISKSDYPVKIRFEHVGLTLGDNKIFEDLNLVFHLNSKTAIIGKVGAGKSLLLEMIVGERSFTSGEILIEYASGLRMPLWSDAVYDEFRNLIAYTPQLPFLSNTSFKNNISLDDQASLEEISRTVALSQLDKDIENFPNGIHEEVGETGINLSGGQKQRVSIARAFFSNRQYFVFDDPLSAVDKNTEAKLFSSIIESCKGFILVTHRLSEIFRCDRVIILDEGRVVDDAKPEDLINKPNSRLLQFLDANKAEEAI